MLRERSIETARTPGRQADRRAPGPHSRPAEHPWIALQITHGNRYVQRLRAQASGSGSAEVSAAVEQDIQRERGGGQALPGGVRGPMEAAFGTVFGNVRVHTGAEADRLNRAVSAHAFTVGRDIFFRDGRYSPGSSDGRELLAHELTHVVQQAEGAHRRLALSDPGDAFEKEADQVARSFSEGERFPERRGLVEGRLLRQPDETVGSDAVEVRGEAAPAHRGRFDAAQEQEAALFTRGQGYDERAIRLIQEVAGAQVDGDFGGDSVEWVAHWQAAHHLTADGKVGLDTLWALVTELRRLNRDLDAFHLAQFGSPSRQFVSDTGAGITSLESGAQPGDPDMTEAAANATLARLGLLSRLTQREPPSNRYDCHGYTFLAGTAWIDDNQVDSILTGNGYAVAPTSAVGDVVVYRRAGSIRHSGVVTAVSGGNVTQIRSKWGRAGLYDHAPNDVPAIYGTWQAYHTTRPGGAILTPQPAPRP